MAGAEIGGMEKQIRWPVCIHGHMIHPAFRMPAGNNIHTGIVVAFCDRDIQPALPVGLLRQVFSPMRIALIWYTRL